MLAQSTIFITTIVQMIFLLKQNLTRLIGTEKAKFIVGVSGGRDSMALLTAMVQLGLDVTAIHINYQLREESSLLDETYVNDYCTQLMCPLIIHRVEKESNSGNTQDWARKIRFDFFEKVQHEINADWIVLAHHLQDLQESQWLKFLRHSIEGLQGMEEKSGRLIRPMLHINRTEIENFVQENKIPFRDDQSNFENKYNRNWLRNAFIPEIKKRFPTSDQAIIDFQKNMTSQNDWLSWFTDHWIKENVMRMDDKQFLPLASIPTSLPAEWILYRWLKPLGFSSKMMDKIACLPQMPRSTFFSSQNHVITFDQNQWVISNREEQPFEKWQGQELPKEFEYAGESWEFELQEHADPSFYGQVGIHQLDFNTIQPPFEIRFWENGDVFQPLGMTGQMNVSDFLTQRKVASYYKRQILVFTAQNKIAAILGWQIADWCKIQQHSASVLVIRQSLPISDPSLL